MNWRSIRPFARLERSKMDLPFIVFKKKNEQEILIIYPNAEIYSSSIMEMITYCDYNCISSNKSYNISTWDHTRAFLFKQSFDAIDESKPSKGQIWSWGFLCLVGARGVYQNRSITTLQQWKSVWTFNMPCMQPHICNKHERRIRTLTKQSWKCILSSAAAKDGAFGMCFFT